MPPSKRNNPADNWMPPRVYRGRSAFEWHPKSGGAIKLCPLGEETPILKATVWEEYRKALEPPSYLVDNLITDYHNSLQFARLSPATQKDYIHYKKRISRVFGHMVPSSVIPVHIRGFMDKLGLDHPVTANRHHSYLSTLFGWGLERGKCDINPAKSVRKFPEVPRDRYIEDWEHNLYKRVARESGSPWMAAASEIAYLCRMRGVEIRPLNEFEISEQGIFVRRAKGSENELTLWSDRLRTAINEARSMHPNAIVDMKRRPVFHTKKGTAYTSAAMKSAHGRIIKKCMQQGLKEPFAFHDFKAKGITDHTENYGGHRSKKMAAVYNRKPKKIDPTR